PLPRVVAGHLQRHGPLRPPVLRLPAPDFRRPGPNPCRPMGVGRILPGHRTIPPAASSRTLHCGRVALMWAGRPVARPAPGPAPAAPAVIECFNILFSLTNSFSRRRRPTRKFVHRGLKGRRVGAGKGAGAEPGRPAPDRKQKRLPEMRSRKAFAVEPAIGLEPMTFTMENRGVSPSFPKVSAVHPNTQKAALRRFF